MARIIDESTASRRLVSQLSELEYALQALRELPDGCAADLGDLARRVGSEKLALIAWSRANLEFARLLASKVRADVRER